jgi:AAA+ ATPase superfamily predicted ATPase
MADFKKAMKYVLSLPPIYFSGRERELQELKQALTTGGKRTAIILGKAGIGKTALAQHFAAESSDFFKGGIRDLSLAEVPIPNGEALSSLFSSEQADGQPG